MDSIAADIGRFANMIFIKIGAYAWVSKHPLGLGYAILIGAFLGLCSACTAAKR